jgi:hypothetical protein
VEDLELRFARSVDLSCHIDRRLAVATWNQHGMSPESSGDLLFEAPSIEIEDA